MPHEYLEPLLKDTGKKIVLLVMDGLGGLPMQDGGLTELETAKTPNMDRLAAEGVLGRTIPVRPGITPGSGPAHLALFGYDPLIYDIGRGVLEAFGVGLYVKPGDVAIRGNLCTLDKDGNISDRRAGRIPNEEALPVIEKMKQIEIPGVEIVVKHVKEYRFTVVMRGEGLDPRIGDTDPQKTGVPPLPVTAEDPAAEKTARLYQEFVDKTCEVLKDEPKANGATLRGFATNPSLITYQEAYGLKAACIAVYPMYRGVSSLVGMDVVEFEGEYPEDEFKAAARVWDQHDFLFIHIKKTDSMGEDGNFDGKVKIIESVDQALPTLLGLKPDVLMITGDHSTPARMRMHSWHPVPFLLWSPELGMQDEQTSFGERACTKGDLGTFQATEVMSLALAHAGRMNKYGA